MKKNLNDTYKEIDDFFAAEPTSNQRAWDIINDFYHMILTFMKENNINKAQLAKRVGKTRSAISQMFNKTPNISVRKMVEIAEAVGLNIRITSEEVPIVKAIQVEEEKVHTFIVVWNYGDYQDEHVSDKGGIYALGKESEVKKYYSGNRYIEERIGNLYH